MKTKKLISPEFRVNVGCYELTEGMSVECYSSQEPQADWCRITLDDEYEGLLDVKNMDDAVIDLGYDGDFDTLLEGSTSKQADDWKTILVRDDMTKLAGIRITATFVDCVPSDVVKYILGRAGITDYSLDDSKRKKKDVFVIDGKDGIEALEEINAFWGIQNKFYFQRKRFYWGTKETQNEMYVLEEDETLLSLEKTGDMWEAETLGIPWLHPGQEVEIIHASYEGTAEIYKIFVKCDERGFTRMYLYFKEVTDA